MNTHSSILTRPYNNLLQGNIIYLYLENEISSKTAFWRSGLQRRIHVINNLATYHLPLGGCDSKLKNFMSVLRFLSNYELNYSTPMIPSEIINFLGTAVCEKIIMEIKKVLALQLI